MSRPWYIYMVECSDGSYYTGVTVDINRRLTEHNSDKGGCRYTRSRRPVCLRASWQAATREQAMKVEYYIKNQLLRSKKQLLLANPQQLMHLLPEIPLQLASMDVY